MAQTQSTTSGTSGLKTVPLAMLGIAAVLSTVAVGIGAWKLGVFQSATETGSLTGSSLLISAFGIQTSCILATLVLFACSTTLLLYRLRRTNVGNDELVRQALVAAKADNAAFITGPEGNIEWINEGFTKTTGHSIDDAKGKLPGQLLLGNLQNLTITQKIRECISQRRALTIDMLCCHRRGHRFWMSLTLTPVIEAGGQLNHFVGIGTDITARKRAEDEVSRIGRRSELLLDAAADGILGFDLDGHISFANASTGRMTGYTSDELVGKPLSTVLYQLKVDPADTTLDELLAGAAFIDGTVQVGDVDLFRRREGTVFAVDYTSTPVFEGDSRIGSVIVFRDVTERVQSEGMRTRQMRQAALRADVAFALAGGGTLQAFLGRAMFCLVKHLQGAFARVWTLNAQDGMLELQASAGIYNHINGHHSRIPVGTLKVGKIAREKSPQISENLLADPDILDKNWVARDHMVAFIGFPLFLEGSLIGVMAMYSRQRLPEDALELFGCVADSIAQGIARKQVAESGLRQAAVLNETRDAIVVIGPDDRIQFVNAAADRLYGWNGVAMTGKAAHELLFPNRSAYEEARACTLQSGEWRNPLSSIERDGQNIPVDSRWRLLNEEADGGQTIVVVQTETTGQRQLEQSLRANQRFESVGLMASGLAHRLVDTLGPIQVSTAVLQAKVGDESTREVLSSLETNVAQSLMLVRQFTTLAGHPNSRPVPVRAGTLLENLRMVVDGTFPRNIERTFEPAAQLWSVRTEPVDLQHALVTYALHARDCVAEGGSVAVTATNLYLQEGADELPADAATGPYVCFVIGRSDCGRLGGSTSVHEAPRKDADGLALDTAGRIIKELGGFVKHHESPGEGMTVSVFLPAEPEPEADSPAPAENPSGNGELVLVVDDELSLLAITKEALEGFGFRVITARDGTEAIAAYSANRSEIQAVITDMLMPNMDGPSTIRVLRKIDPAVRIIASSGMLEPDRISELTGFTDLTFLSKPYTATTLVQTVHQVLHTAA